MTLIDKLNPSRFPGMSPFMAAVVGYVLGESFTDPQIAEMRVREAFPPRIQGADEGDDAKGEVVKANDCHAGTMSGYPWRV